MATLDNGTTVLTPDLVLAWQASRPTKTVAHEIIGRAYPDVTLQEAGTRTGTLRIFFLDYADAQTAQDELSLAAVWDLDAPEVTGLSMRFVVGGGQVSIEAVGGDLDRWVVECPFQEVPA
jgi:hypothetical protein